MPLCRASNIPTSRHNLTRSSESLAEKFPLNKLDKYQVLNLVFDAIAFYFTVKFTAHGKNEVLATLTWGFVVTIAFFCVMNASKA